MASDETSRITEGAPVFLSIDASQQVNEPGFTMTEADVASAAARSHSSMLTDAVAFESMSAPASSPNPLSSMVRSNFLRGARGLVDEPIAQRLRQVENEAAEAVTGLIRETFSEDAVVRMERTTLLVQYALDPGLFGARLHELNGRMSTDELRAFLPWLLNQDNLQLDSSFWSSFGGLFDFAQLEQLADDLDAVDISMLVVGNSRSWSARRAYVGLYVPSSQDADQDADYNRDQDRDLSESNDEHVEVRSSDAPTWAFRQGTLSLNIGERLIRVSNSGNKLKARPGSMAPKWDALGDVLGEYDLNSVSVTGVARSFRVDARESADVKSDIDSVVASVEDNYYVNFVEIYLEVVRQEDGALVEMFPVTVDFAGSILVAPVGVQMGQLVRAAAVIIGGTNLSETLDVSQ
ncbi:hypothetical protein [Clavibacter michiganensis]|uniref:hypothetical protein n=1 Tax=Clavibacter michiganensis TaxID=28447 RepID=UPI0013666DF9|nr:hypothetical protein [Clavibacter michiganensis]